MHCMAPSKPYNPTFFNSNLIKNIFVFEMELYLMIRVYNRYVAIYIREYHVLL